MNRLRPIWRWSVPTIALVVALVLVVPAFVGDAPDSQFDSTVDSTMDSTMDSPAGFAPGEAGLRAVIDPETGELAIGADALRLQNGQSLQNDKAVDVELRQMLSRSTEGLVEEVRPDGGVSVHLEGRFMSMSVARVAEDGTVETLCTENADHAEAFLAGAAETAPETDANGWEVR